MNSKIEDKKNQLRKASSKYEEMINDDLNVISEAATEWGGKLLVIGGAMLLSYLGVRAIIDKKHRGEGEEIDKETKEARMEARNIFIKSISDKAALVLLALIREYIVKLLEDTPKEHDRGDIQ
jgi:hypothetical protein